MSGRTVSTLKQAEQEAAAIVNMAREDRKARMKAATADAKKEVEEYKAAREAKLRTVQPEAQALEARVSRVTAETDRKIAMLEAEYQRNKDGVISMLLQVTLNTENPFASKQ